MSRYITFVHLAKSGGIEMNGMSAKVNTHRISVEILRSLFDDRVSLIPVMHGTKRMAQKWSDQPDGSYPAPCINDKKLGRMGIAVRLGNRDHNIISIDIDGDELMKCFMDRNPIARETLISKGSRGANFWFRLSHECPDLQGLKHEGVSVGEFRGNGGVTIIQGLHENKTDYYRFLNKAPVLEIKLEQLKWMDGSPMTEVIRTGKDPVYTRTKE